MSQDGRVATFIGDGGEAIAPHGEGSPSTEGRRWVEAPHGFTVPTSDFLHGFLHEYGVQLQHLPPNVVS